jgi:hypothetical protein
MKLQTAIVVTGSGLAAVVLADNIAGESRNYVKIGGYLAMAVGVASLFDGIAAAGGLGSLLGGLLQKPKLEPVANGELGPEPVVNPGGAPASQFLALDGQVLTPSQDSTLHARQQLTLDGTYPVELNIENNRDTPVSGFVQLEAVEATIFGGAQSSRLISPPISMPPHTFQRFAMNMPCASGRFVLGVKVNLRATFVQDDGRGRIIGRLSTDFLLA